MKIYVLLHSSTDEQLGYETIVKVYATKEEAKAAMETEIEAAAKWLCGQYADQPDALECVKHEIFEDGGWYGDGVLREQWDISEHEIEAMG